MTTKNNLIDKVGGIDKAREIVSGAPSWAKYWITKNEYHMSVISFPNMTDQKSYLIDDLRTAIAQHEQLGNSEGFKAGQQSRQAEVNEKDKRIAELKLWNSNQSQTVKLKELSIDQLKELLQQLIDDEYTTMRPSMAYEIQKALRGDDDINVTR